MSLRSTEILVADADPRSRSSVGDCLRAAGYAVREATDGPRLLAEVAHDAPDLAVIDLQLPLLGGLQLCSCLRRVTDLPLIVYTELADESIRLQALSLYADDYVLKAACPQEVAARVGCVLRRARQPRATAATEVRVDDRLTLNFHYRQARTPAGVVHLTRTEVRLLELLLSNAGRTLPSKLLQERLWGDTYGSQGSLWEYVRRLRRKLGDDVSNPHYIVNEPGLGYSFARTYDAGASGRTRSSPATGSESTASSGG